MCSCKIRSMWRVFLRALPLFFLFSCAHQTSFIPRKQTERANFSDLQSQCKPLSLEDRKRVLAIAHPENFPLTRYRKGPRSERGLENETDCSHFVHEVYQRAGLPYNFRTTSELGKAEEFERLPEEAARPGDLMLFRGHVGIVDENGKIISALRTRKRKRKSSIASIDRRFFRTFRGQRYVLRYRCSNIEGEPSAEGRSTASEKRVE